MIDGSMESRDDGDHICRLMAKIDSTHYWNAKPQCHVKNLQEKHHRNSVYSLVKVLLHSSRQVDKEQVEPIMIHLFREAKHI